MVTMLCVFPSLSNYQYRDIFVAALDRTLSCSRSPRHVELRTLGSMQVYYRDSGVMHLARIVKDTIATLVRSFTTNDNERVYSIIDTKKQGPMSQGWVIYVCRSEMMISMLWLLGIVRCTLNWGMHNCR